MNSHRAPLGELELDHALRAFLADGAEAQAQRIADLAMAEVAATPQVRSGFGPRSSTRMRLAWASAAGLAAVLVLAIGASFQPVGPVRPSASASTGPELVLSGSEADGYQLLVPQSWQEVDSGFADVRTWEGADGAVMVSYGASIFDGGAVTQCGPPTPEWPLCQTDTYTYSVPLRLETDGVAPLSIEGYVRDRCLGGCDVNVTATELGGERAEQNQTVAADQRVTYVSTFHNRRPVIVYWSEPVSGTNNADLIDQMRESFTFLDAPVVSPTPFVDPTELVPYRNVEAGYEMLVPRFWGEGTDHVNHPDVHDFGNGRGFGTRGHPALAVSVGSPDGTVTVCQETGHSCDEVVATTLDELDRQLVSTPAQFTDVLPDDRSGELVLAGEAGRFKMPGRLNNCLGCPGVLYHAYAIKDGRPIVISVDWWTIAFGELPDDYLEEIIASLRLLD